MNIIDNDMLIAYFTHQLEYVESLRRQNEDLIWRNAELRNRLLTDSLTGLRNRTWLDENLPNHDGFLVLLDLDRFKQVNDLHGYEAGDQVLREFAHFLATSCRSGRDGRAADAVASPVRRGGDEFLVLTDSEEAANALQERLGRWCSLRWGVTVSSGIGRTEAEAHEQLHFEKVFKSLGR